MKVNVGDLIRIVQSPSLDTQPALLHVTEVAKTGLSVVVISGPHLGSTYFLPYFNREIEVISSTKKE